MTKLHFIPTNIVQPFTPRVCQMWIKFRLIPACLCRMWLALRDSLKKQKAHTQILLLGHL